MAAGKALPDSLVQQLVASVLDDEAVQLALGLRDGGPHLVRRAIELAALVIDAEGEGAAETKDTAAE